MCEKTMNSCNFFLSSVFCIAQVCGSMYPQQNPPLSWSTNPTAPNSGVYIFDSSMSREDIQLVVSSLYETNGNGYETGDSDHGRFSPNRYAIFFKPGDYTSKNLDVEVGYYTSVHGLGRSPHDTILSDVRSLPSGNLVFPGALNTFWRSAENFLTKPLLPFISGSGAQNIGMVWAVSQSCPLRRVIINGNNANSTSTGLYLSSTPNPPTPPYPYTYGFGGFMADCQILDPSGEQPWMVNPGEQFQWFTRNSNITKTSLSKFGYTWPYAIWNAVFVGCQDAPATTNPYAPVDNYNNYDRPPPQGNPFTTVQATPVIAEKPYISFDNNKFYLNIPPLEFNKIGVTGSGSNPNYEEAEQVGFENVYVTTSNDFTTVKFINSALSEGLHVILTPGIYNLDDSIKISRDNLCILGIGFPTLVAPINGNPCIEVGKCDGVKIGAILLQASTSPNTNKVTHALLKWGEEENVYFGKSNNPGFLYDCFGRVGGSSDYKTNPVAANIIVQINNGHVVCDNCWLWRAGMDPSGFITNLANPCDISLQVNGPYVTGYGLSCEHALKHVLEWNGDYGSVYFYQSEFPYDMNQAYANENDIVNYYVGPRVTHHNAFGVGVYCVFNTANITLPSGFRVVSGSSDINFTNAFTRFEFNDNNFTGTLLNVINSSGEGVTIHRYGPSYIHKWTPASSSKNIQSPRRRVVYK